METVILVLEILLIVCCACLITVVLMQSTKSAGLGGAFGGDTQSFTPRGKAASREVKLQKATKILAIAGGVIAVVVAILS